MQDRFALRFESGERQGEVVRLPDSVLSAGRRPGNGLQILDASVSGKHAEFVVEDGAVLLRDLGSTNGTRVGPERVSERRLAHGDEVVLGNVRLTFLDSEIDAAPPPRRPSAADDLDLGPGATSEAAGEDVRRISADKLARSGAKSRFALLGLLLLAGGGGAAWFLTRGGGGESSGQGRAVVPVAGNLLAAGYSFEEGEGWRNDESAPAVFAPDARAGFSGDTGLRAALVEGEWAAASSDPVPFSAGGALELGGRLRVLDGAAARLGVVFEDSSGAAAPVTAWSAPSTGGAGDSGDGGWTEVALATRAPARYDRARAVVRARSDAGEGTADVDDVRLVPAGAAPGHSLVTVNDYELHLLGEPRQTALLFRIDSVLVGPLGATDARGEPVALSAEAAGPAFALQAGAGAANLSLRVAAQLAGGGVATAGAGGYRTHQIEFEREDTTDALLGQDRDQVVLRLDRPATVRGRPEGDAFLLEVELQGPTRARIQVSFRDERAEAENLARRARDETAKGDLGAALATWGTLLESHPFERARVAEAATAQAQLVAQGLGEVQALRADLERARFFRLVDLFREIRERAEALAARYANSEVAEAAREVGAEVAGDLAVLEQDLDRVEVRRLTAILRSLQEDESPTLVERVRARLKERFGVEPAPASAGNRE